MHINNMRQLEECWKGREEKKEKEGKRKPTYKIKIK